MKETGHKTECEGYGGGSIDTPGVVKPENIWSNQGFSPTDDHPVAFVSWNDAKKFCAWLSLKEKKHYRLPTEAEWEWASRAGTVADAETKESLGWYSSNSGNKSRPVGKLPPNTLGLFDMYGNVAEFCQDWWYDDLSLPPPSGTMIDPGGPVDPKVPTEDHRRVVRGGGFMTSPPFDLATLNPRQAWSSTGFRVICEVAAPDLKDAEPSVPAIPSVEELLKTREVLTVAQDGSGDYKTLQSALDKVQAGEVILVKN